MNNKLTAGLILSTTLLTGCVGPSIKADEEYCYSRGYDFILIDDGWTSACVTEDGPTRISKIKYFEERGGKTTDIPDYTEWSKTYHGHDPYPVDGELL